MLYDLRRVQDAVLAALYNAPIGGQGGGRAGQLELAGKPTALVDVASRLTQPLRLRQAAAVGLLLKTGQITASC